MTNRMWVALQPDQSCLIPWPTVCEWHCFVFCQVASLIMSHPIANSMWVALLYFFARQSHQSCSSHDQQKVSDTALFLSQVVSSIISHGMNNREWVTPLYLFAMQSFQSCLCTCPTVCEWHCFMSLPDSIIISHPITNRVWVSLLNLFASLSHNKQGVSDIALFLCLINHVSSHDQQEVSAPLLCLINHVSSHNQQGVSGTALFLCQAVSPIISHVQ